MALHQRKRGRGPFARRLAVPDRTRLVPGVHGPCTDRSGSHPARRTSSTRRACGALLAGDALGVDPQQDINAMTGPLRHLRCGHPAVEPRGRRGVAQVVWPARERRGDLCGRQRAGASEASGMAADALRERATAGTADQPAVRGRAVLGQVRVQEHGQLRRAGRIRTCRRRGA
jgi:hypothetical protein